MPDGGPEEGEAHRVDLAARDLVLLFGEDAIRHAAHVNLHKDGRVAFHIKYLQMRGGLVLNDMRDGAWAPDVFLPCLRPVAGGGIRVTLGLRGDIPCIEVPGAAPLPLGDRFDLDGPLTARVPSVVRVLEAGASAPSPILQMVSAEAAGLALGVDAVVGTGGAFHLEGWVDDRRAPLRGISLVDFATGRREMLPAHRVRRPDVESHLGAARPAEFGFWTAAAAGGEQLSAAGLSLVFEDGSGVPIDLPPAQRQGARDFFEFLLAAFGRRNVIGNLTARSFADLEAGHGALVARLHREIAATRAVTSRARFGAQARDPSISLVCVLYGIPDFLYLLVSQFARFGGTGGIEFVFVSNSPELEETLLRDAEIASLVFDAEIALVSLNQNCGFSHANNVGVAEARARSIAIVNPDVFPRDAAAVAHLRALGEAGTQGGIVGGKLHYADGSVMHEGMYFEQDRRLSVLCRAPVWTVEHYRKGFPDTGGTQVREVPALTGALMVLDRALYERIGGFDTDVVFGHYEDADLCLRIREAGGRVLYDPTLAFWHYEGMGSVKRPEHVGSGLYNRWRFARRWGGRIAEMGHG